MPDGRRDPLDRAGQQPIRISVLNDNTTYIEDHAATMRALTAVGCRKQRALGGGWMFEGRMTEDVIGWLTVRGYVIHETL
jgi:hypothetical protein